MRKPTADGKLRAEVDEFKTKCRNVTLGFRSPASVKSISEIANKVGDYVETLMYFKSCDSQLLRFSATEFLNSLRKAKVANSSRNILECLSEILTTQVQDCSREVAKLSSIIGNLVQLFNNSLNQLGWALTNFIKMNIACRTTYCRERLDFMPVIVQYQQFLSITTFITATLLNCEAATVETQEAAIVVVLAFFYLTICVQASSSAVQDMLYQDNGCAPNHLTLVTQPLVDGLVEFAGGISAVKFPFDENIRKLPATLTHFGISFNPAVKEVLGY